MSDPHTRSVIMSPAAIRNRIMADVRVPADLLELAFQTTRNKLTAKKTLVFAEKGLIKDKLDVEDNAAQLTAADQVYSMAGVYTRDKDVKQTTPGFAMRIDPATGVIEVVIGHNATEEIAPAAPLEVLDAGRDIEETRAVVSSAMAPPASMDRPAPAPPRKIPYRKGMYIIHDEVVD